LVSAWPHKLRPKTAAIIAITVTVVRAVALSIAAYFDNSLWLPGEAVGLFEHPGILAIVLGDVVVFLLSRYASQMTRLIGRRLPTDRRTLVQRYFRQIVFRRVFKQRGMFIRTLLFLSFVGAVNLVNQTVQVLNPDVYYGHDTFNSIWHLRSFWVNRMNLFISWCIVIPLFASYVIAHTIVFDTFSEGAISTASLSFNPRTPISMEASRSLDGLTPFTSLVSL
jgi:hypothetical protein